MSRVRICELCGVNAVDDMYLEESWCTDCATIEAAEDAYMYPQELNFQEKRPSALQQYAKSLEEEIYGSEHDGDSEHWDETGC